MLLRVMALALLMAGVAFQAQAQSRAELALKVERLEREMIALENRLRGGGSTPQPSASGSASVSDRALLADLAAKIGSVERQMRALTGRLEEIEFQQRQFQASLDRFGKEMELQQQSMMQTQLEQAAGQNRPVQSPAVQPTGQTTDAAVQDTQASVPAQPEIVLPDGDAAAQYQYAFDFIKKNDLKSGFEAMDLFLKSNPEGSLAGNAKFWLGRIHLREGRSPQAAQQLLALIEEHPNHDKRVDALVDLADVLIALDSAPDACNALAEFRRSEDKASPRLKARAERTASTAGCDY